jgi:ribosomal protein S18 acetylase RimI-like enzyme
MQIRAAVADDLILIGDIDATVESTQYLHLDRTGEGLAAGWSLEVRPLREKRIEPNRLDEDHAFTLRQIAGGIEEGWATVLEIEPGRPAALLLARPQPQYRVVQLLDVRVDYDFRRQGLGLALGYHLIGAARDGDWRAIAAETRTSNLAANRYLEKLGFTLAGVDTMRHSNHDLVKEAATLLWYLQLGE